MGFTREGELYRQIDRPTSRLRPPDDSGPVRGARAGRTARAARGSLPAPERPETCYKVLKPERLPFISYPYEWCFSQLKQQALACSNVQKTALNHGMSLRDATAFNMQFRRGRPR